MKTPVNTKDFLLRHGIRPSLQRLAVMEYLLTHRTHPTAEEIYQALSSRIPTLSRTTIYNTLSLLTEHGAAISLTIDPRGTRFDGDLSVHGHFLCGCCGAVHDVWFDTPPTLPQLSEGHTVHRAQIHYHGVCGRCASKLETTN